MTVSILPAMEVRLDFVLTYSKGKDREGMLMDLSGLEGVREVSG